MYVCVINVNTSCWVIIRRIRRSWVRQSFLLLKHKVFKPLRLSYSWAIMRVTDSLFSFALAKHPKFCILFAIEWLSLLCLAILSHFFVPGMIQTLINQKYTEIEKHVHISNLFWYTQWHTDNSLFNHRFSIDFII